VKTGDRVIGVVRIAITGSGLQALTGGWGPTVSSSSDASAPRCRAGRKRYSWDRCVEEPSAVGLATEPTACMLDAIAENGGQEVRPCRRVLPSQIRCAASPHTATF
jgi:hypothetical protein